jgi:hypothetical protein
MAKKHSSTRKMHDLFSKLEKSHRDIIEQNNLDMYLIKDKACQTFEKRERQPLENFIYLCNKINEMCTSISASFNSYEKLDAYSVRCEQYAVEVNTLFSTLLECYNILISSSNVSYCVLLECCKTLQHSVISGIFSNKIIKYQYKIEGQTEDKSLKEFICYFSHYVGLKDMVFQEYQSTYFKQYLNDIKNLETLGEKICEREHKEWYKNHIYTDNVWQERQYDEMSNAYPEEYKQDKRYEKYHIFPWYYNRSISVKYHNFKKDMAIVINSDIKYKVVEVDNFTDLISLYYNTFEGVELICDRNIQYRYDKDIVSQCLMLINTGNVNNGDIEILSIYELREKLKDIQKYDKYFFI